MPTTDPIKVPFEGDEADLVAAAKKAQAEMDRFSKTLKDAGVSTAAYNKAAKDQQKALQDNQKSVKSASMSWTEFRSMYSTVLDVVRVGQAVWKETGAKFVDYALEVGQAARTLGTTTEEASRLIQVSDDVGISFEALSTSMKIAQKDGFQPNIAGLAAMSDEYLKLAPGVERTQFLLDRFGKSGTEMAKIMEKGGDSIREMSAAIADNMIVTEQGFQDAEKYRIAVDNLSDAWSGFSMEIGSKAVPAMTDLLTATTNNIEEGYSWEKVLYGLPIIGQIKLIQDLKAAHEENSAATAEATTAAEEAGAAFEDEAEKAARLAEEQKLAAEAAKEMTDANTQFASTVMNLSEETKTYRDQQAAVVQEYRNGSITADEYGAKMGELEEKHKTAINSMVLDLLKMKLTADGTFDDTDLNKYLAGAEKLGLITKEDKDATIDLFTEVDNLNASLSEANGPMLHVSERAKDGSDNFGAMADAGAELGESLRKEVASGAAAATAALNSIPTQIDVFINVHQRGSIPNFATAAGAGVGQNTAEMRDSGGPGVAGQVYMIGKSAQPEAFIPSTDGQFVPNADKLFQGRDDSAIIEAIERNAPDYRAMARAFDTVLQQRGW